MLAVDGDNETCARINADDPAWWRVELNDNYPIQKILIFFNQNKTGYVSFF